MFSLDDVCLLCHTNSKNLTTILSEDSDGVVIEKKLKFFLFELVQSKLAISKQICINCLKNLNFVYKFKHMCLRNIIKFNNNIHTFGNEEKSSKNKITVTTQNSSQSKSENVNISPPKKIIKIIPINLKQNLNLKSSFPVINNQIIRVNKSTNQVIAIDKKNNQIVTVGEKENPVIQQRIFPTVFVKDEPISDETSEDTFEQETMDLNQEKDIMEIETPTDTNEESSNSNEPNEKSLLKSILENKTPNTYKRRSRSSTNLQALQCDICDRKFGFFDYYIEHKKEHIGQEPYKCSLCFETFVKMSELKTHEEQHDYNSPFECKFCKKIFEGKQIYRRHIKNAHTKEHMCEICDKKFRDKSSLNSHMHWHTGEKPFTCKVCDRKFRMKTQLNKHNRETHIDKQYKCNLCPCQYDKKFGLTQHKRLVHGIKKKTLKL